jgi:hypothetical protein
MENKSTMPYPTNDGRQQESASTTVAHSFYNPTTIYMKCQWSRPKKINKIKVSHSSETSPNSFKLILTHR